MKVNYSMFLYLNTFVCAIKVLKTPEKKSSKIFIAKVQNVIEKMQQPLTSALNYHLLEQLIYLIVIH